MTDRRMTTLITAAALAATALLPLATASPVLAASPCRVTNAATTPASKYASIQEAIGDELDTEAALTLSFTGTCAESIFISREGATTIIGKKTPATGTPTLDATGTGTSAIGIYSGPVTLRGFTVTGGTGSGAADQPKVGGGLYIESSSVTLTGMRITRNETRDLGDGGGIYATAALGPIPGVVAPARLVIGAGTVIEDNASTGRGGGIYAGPGMTVRIVGNARLAKNHAASNGGGIAIDGEVAKESTLFVGGTATVEDNDAGLSGGGIASDGSVTTSIAAQASVRTNTASVGGGIDIDTDGALRLAGTVYGNSASIGGGGILLGGASLTATRSARIVRNEAPSGGGLAIAQSVADLKGSLVSGNIATTGDGGGIRATGDTSLLTLTGARITGNRARFDGGGLRLLGRVSVLVDGSTIAGNRAGFAPAGVNARRADPAGGGGGGTGAGISIVGSSSLTIRGDTAVRDNVALSGDSGPGAGISILNSDVAVQGALSVVGNRFQNAGNGGGIGIDGGSLEITGPAGITGNSAQGGSGGGLWARAAAVTLSRVTIATNVAGTNGGGAHVQGGTMGIDHGAIRGNRTGQYGGGLALVGALVGSLDAVAVRGNHAVAGGGLYSVADLVTITGGTIAANTVTLDGGGIYFGGSGLMVDGATLRGNVAEQNGGGLYTGAGGALSVAGSTVKENRATFDGGGVALIGDGPSEISATSVRGNVAGARGGGLMVLKVAKLSFGAGNHVTGNVAKGTPRPVGGGVYVAFPGSWDQCGAVTGNSPDQVAGEAVFGAVSKIC